MQSIFEITNIEQDLYAVLGCVDTSSTEQIKTEYKRLALLHHPDKLSPQDKSTQFEKIKDAYDIVGDPINRAKYERWRKSQLMIPFSDFINLGTHAQTVHWQSLPTQMTLTKANETDTSLGLKTLRVPPTVDQLPRIHIQTNSFWKPKSYTINDRS
ncbi:hypothetical protein EDC94DRAFT_599630 [Helicostylum pulchrum]|uniref:J domain-containing protein n=1 Tax=Helicostylum pulchrum TaxID=562976 RepID=A0ABP9XSN8_9FUNG|nr:hypothetical protein EDC94DRAFT_599630 [Helicostylum pulchrum]